MDLPRFSERRYRVTDRGEGVVCDVPAKADELEALRAALGHARERAAGQPLDSADAVLELRALGALEDRLSEVIAAGPPTPLTLDHEQAIRLCEVTGTYLAERDFEGYTPPEQRERMALLGELTGPLMDTCSELVAAAHEARERDLLRQP
jgi:hypothetical protein